MPTVRKVPAQEAADWDVPIDPAALLSAGKIADRVGLIRLDYPNHGSVGWSARVYAAGKEHARFFSDTRYGGPEQALRMAAAWRDAMRLRLPATRLRPRGRSGILRVDRPDWKNVGYFAWHDGKRRYFSDARYGGPQGAQEAAAAWAAGVDVERPLVPLHS